MTSPPVTWDGLNLNPLAEDATGVLPVVELVEGWYDTPDYDGHNAALVLTDGAVRGPKVAAARVVTINGAAAGRADALALYRDRLVMRAAKVLPAPLTITDAAGRDMTANVRADSDGLRHTFYGPNLFKYQVTLTAADPRLYGPEQSVLMSNLPPDVITSGWKYDQGTRVTVTPTGDTAQINGETITCHAGDTITSVFDIRPLAGLPNGAWIQLFSPSAGQWGSGVNIGPLKAGQRVTLNATWTIPTGGADITARLIMQNTAATAPVDVYSGTVLINGVMSNANPYFAGGYAPWYGQSANLTWNGPGYRTYPYRQYPGGTPPNQATLWNQGNVPAPVTALYTGLLTTSRLNDNASGRHVGMIAIHTDEAVLLDTGTLTAWAPGGASRASYVLPGSQTLFVGPQSTEVWSLYATGTGSLLLTWRSAWQ